MGDWEFVICSLIISLSVIDMIDVEIIHTVIGVLDSCHGVAENNTYEVSCT